MRRESSTVVALVGEVSDGLLGRLAQSPNVSVARAPGTGRAAGTGTASGTGTAAGTGTTSGTGTPASGGDRGPRPGWEPGALAMREAARRRSTYVIVADDPLAGVAAGWRAMWDLAAGSPGAAGYEGPVADALGAWRGQRFELPDYYLVIAPAGHGEAGPDFYLGPLHALRPRRVAVASIAGSPAQTAQLLDTLRALEHGPWWPPLDELLDSARRFYAGGLAAAVP